MSIEETPSTITSNIDFSSSLESFQDRRINFGSIDRQSSPMIIQEYSGRTPLLEKSIGYLIKGKDENLPVEKIKLPFDMTPKIVAEKDSMEFFQIRRQSLEFSY